jgi:hypothetical protein
MEEKKPFCRIPVYPNELDSVDCDKKLLVFAEETTKKTKKT